MDADVCRKCDRWTEFVALVDGRDIAMTACGCTRFNIVFDAVVDGERYLEVKASMARHRRKSCATHNGRAFWRIVDESFGVERKGMLEKLGRRKAPEGCPFYVEHKMREWNGGGE